VNGLIIAVNKSLAAGGAHIMELKDYDAYTHTLEAFGGFATASITLNESQANIEDWLEWGIGRHIVVYDGEQQICFEGFVDRVTAALGPATITRGPLTEISNRVWGVYAEVTNPAANPPTVGARTITVATQDNVSIAKYGIFETVLSLGTCETTTANQIQASYLVEHAEPDTSHDIGDFQGPSVTIDLKGYYSILDAIIYNQTVNSGYQAVSDTAGKIQDVLTLARSINSWCVSADYSRLAYNGLLTLKYENDDMKCSSVIKDLVTLGDVNEHRYAFGFYENRVPRYWDATSQEFQYQLYVFSEGKKMLDSGNKYVYPWRIRPGKWTKLVDVMPGRAVSSVLRADPRTLFIEGVTYTAPYDFSCRGGKFDKLSQKLAQLGLAGVSA
jgi:hypothetical protein